jgi:membrane-bound ClpP family serine protease
MSHRDSEMLALLVEQAEGQGGDLVMIRALVEEACDLGAARALERLGLSDATAHDDVRELRELLRGWRDAKRSARNALLGWIARIAVALLLLGLAVKLDLVGLLRA